MNSLLVGFEYEEMIFSIDHASKKVVAIIQNEGQTEEFECVIKACENPVCTCGSVYLELIPWKSQVEGGRPLLPLRVSIDLDKQILEHKGRGKTSIDDLAFAKLLLSKLDQDDFRFLHNNKFKFKNQITETSSIISNDAYFDYGSVEKDGLMSAYFEYYHH